MERVGKDQNQATVTPRSRRKERVARAPARSVVQTHFFVHKHLLVLP